MTLDLRRQFRRDGFCIVPNAVSAAVLEDALAEDRRIGPIDVFESTLEQPPGFCLDHAFAVRLADAMRPVVQPFLEGGTVWNNTSVQLPEINSRN